MMKSTGRHSNSEPNIGDVAEAAGVSIRTVSRVLNRSPLVNGETREKVELAIANLGFRPSLRARALAMGRSFLIGMIYNDRNALVLGTVQRGIIEEASPDGYEIIMHPTPSAPEDVVEDVVSFVRRSRVDGVVVLPPVSGVPGLAAALETEGVFAVCLSPTPVKGYGSVVLSLEREASGDVARYLADLGHSQIAMITGPQDVLSAKERREGFATALTERGIALVAEAEGDYGFESGLEAAARILDKAHRPTAIFASNDIMAAAVLKAAAERGIAVPKQLSVVGFDGSVLAHMVTPALTTVSRPFDKMARHATRQLLDVLAGGAISGFEPLALELERGESSGPPATPRRMRKLSNPSAQAILPDRSIKSEVNR